MFQNLYRKITKLLLKKIQTLIKVWQKLIKQFLINRIFNSINQQLCMKNFYTTLNKNYLTNHTKYLISLKREKINLKI